MTASQRFYSTILLAILVSVGMFLSDLYAPSLPAISHAMGTSTNLVKFSISSYLLGLALPQLLFGPLSDKYGRKPIVLFGLALAFAGSVMCMFTQDIGWLIFGRFIQGLGAAACIPLGRIIAFDLFKREQLAKVVSYMGMIFSIIPAIAPVIGGYLQHSFGWQANFVLMALLVLAALVLMLFCLRETNMHKNPHSMHKRHLLLNYKRVMCSKHFWGYALVSSLGLSAMMVYATMGPFLLQQQMHLTPVMYGWVTLIILAAYLVGKYINTLLITKWGISKLVRFGNWLMFLSGVVMTLFALMHIINLYVLVIPLIFYLIGCGTNMPNAMAGAMRGFEDIKGSAGALFGFLQIFGAFIATSIAARFHETTQLPFALVMTCLGALAIFMFAVLSKKV